MQTAAFPKYLPLQIALALLFTGWHREPFLLLGLEYLWLEGFWSVVEEHREYFLELFRWWAVFTDVITWVQYLPPLMKFHLCATCFSSRSHSLPLLFIVGASTAGSLLTTWHTESSQLSFTVCIWAIALSFSLSHTNGFIFKSMHGLQNF